MSVIFPLVFGLTDISIGLGFIIPAAITLNHQVKMMETIFSPPVIINETISYSLGVFYDDLPVISSYSPNFQCNLPADISQCESFATFALSLVLKTVYFDRTNPSDTISYDDPSSGLNQNIGIGIFWIFIGLAFLSLAAFRKHRLLRNANSSETPETSEAIPHNPVEMSDLSVTVNAEELDPVVQFHKHSDD